MNQLQQYRAKSDAELRYIARDAHAMRGHSPHAEAKYLDQVNDACTVLNERRVRQPRESQS
jgi:hypothetical protein